MCKKDEKPCHLEKGPKIHAVLINWNSSEYTIPCIESLVRGKVPPSKIIIVDNGSTDGSPEIIEKRYRSIDLIRNNHNLGFAAGTNQGIRRAIATGADFVWVLNNDTIVDPECLSELLKACRKFTSGACFSGKIYLSNPKNMIWYAGSYRHWLHLAPIHRRDGQIDYEKQEEAKAVPFISGCCMLFPRWALETFGLFIEDYFCYSEDSEWSWRATSAGVQLFYVPSAKLWHRVSASTDKNNQAGGSTYPPATSLFYMTRNHLWATRLWAKPPIRKYIALIINIAIEIRMVVRQLIKADYARAGAICKGICDGLWKSVPRWDFDK